MSAVMRRVVRNSVCRQAFAEVLRGKCSCLRDERPDCAMDGNGPLPGLNASVNGVVFEMHFPGLQGGHSETGVNHGERGHADRIVSVLPQDFNFIVGEWFSVLVVVRNVNLESLGYIAADVIVLFRKRPH